MARTPFFTKLVSHDNPIPQAARAEFRRRIDLPGPIPDGQLRQDFRLRIGTGTDQYPIEVPHESRYAGASVITVPPSAEGATAQIKSQPPNGHLGRGTIEVEWFCPPGRQVRYRVRAYAEADLAAAPPTEEVYITDLESVERLRSLIASRRAVRVYIGGADAEKIHDTGLFGGPQATTMAFIADDVLIIMILAAAAVSLTAVAAVVVITVTAAALGYQVDMDFEAGGVDPGTGRWEAPRMIFILVPPSD